jgi:hypothetical protein
MKNDEEPTGKTCTKCGEWKPLEEFHRDKAKKFGRRTECKKCVCEKERKRYEENPEKARERQRKWRKEKPEKGRERQCKWRKEKPEKAREIDRAYKRRIRQRQVWGFMNFTPKPDNNEQK